MDKKKMTELLMAMLVEGTKEVLDRKDGEPVSDEEMASVIANALNEEEVILINLAMNSMIGVTSGAIGRMFGYTEEEEIDLKDKKGGIKWQ